MTTKYVYFFGGGKADGRADMKNLLGGKGANLAEMANLGLPVPAGFTLVTDYCNVYLRQGRTFDDQLRQQVADALKQVEQVMGMRYGDPENPLLVSCRSGARQSMPGMMETVLNVGLCTRTIPGLIRKSGNERFVYDAYRRLITMYSDVVMEKAEDVEPAEGKGIRHQLEHIMQGVKEKKGYHEDTDLTTEDLKYLCDAYRKKIKEVLGRDFPDDPQDQLWGGIGAVFKSWNGRRAIAYRRIEGIPHEWGTACTVQSMVFGNLGNTSATGVAFTRNPATGENKFYGEWLVNAQGEDVVAGIRTPNPLNEATKSEQNQHLHSLEKEWPETYRELDGIRLKLEQHYKDMQDIEFTIQEKKLYMLQCRSGKRTGTAALNIALDMLQEGLIDERTVVKRVAPAQLDELLHPVVDPKAEKTAPVLATGLPAGPGGALGEVVFTSADAVAAARAGKKVILVREETNPEDVDGMRAAEGILTARGGMTCLAGETQVLTDQGLLAAETAFDLLESGQPLRILSFDTRTLRPVWRNVVAAGRRPSEVITVIVSPTGRAEHSTLRLTADHKVFTLENRQLVKKRVDAVLQDEEFGVAIDQVPPLGETATSTDLAYVVGAILSDGCIRLWGTKGSVTFVQKPTPEKAEFVAAVEQAFARAFGVPLSYVRQRETEAEFRGRIIRGSVEDRICFRRDPAERLAEIRANIGTWVLSLDRRGLLHFLAGYIDGDGCHSEGSSDVRVQVVVAQDRQDVLVGLALACLRLGIVPQLTRNREAHLLQISERVEDVLAFTRRVRAEIRERAHEARCLSIRGLFADIVEQVNYHGRVRYSVKDNWMWGVDKIRRDVLPLCPPQAHREVGALLAAPLRSVRLAQTGTAEETLVYNFEVEAQDELDKNFIAFSSGFIPVLVSNSHAALVARGWGKCCIVGAGKLKIRHDGGKGWTLSADGKTLKAGDLITLNGTRGIVYQGAVDMVDATENPRFAGFMKMVDQFRTLGVRTNADTPEDARVARNFGAEGIGLFRTEHMFYGKGSEQALFLLRKMILSGTTEERVAALQELSAFVKRDIKATLEAMDGLPVTIRLLDPPLHEFVPHNEAARNQMAEALKIDPAEVQRRGDALHEVNPMMGHRGVRLGITYPEISEMQIRAILEATAELKKDGKNPHPELMVPVTCDVTELEATKKIFDRVLTEVREQTKVAVECLYGTMIEIPRACLLADRMAKVAEFFSFGTNDLTQMTFGFSRDDTDRFLPAYLDQDLLKADPFQTLDTEGVGQLIEMAVRKGRETRKELKIGICGEHGGDPASVKFCFRTGLNYVSCSPFRVPIARLAAAQAALEK